MSTLPAEQEDFTVGSKVLLYGQETEITGFHVSYNEGLEKYETIILTIGRGDPFERTLAGGNLKLIQSKPIDWDTATLKYTAPAQVNTEELEKEASELAHKKTNGDGWLSAAYRDGYIAGATRSVGEGKEEGQAKKLENERELNKYLDEYCRHLQHENRQYVKAIDLVSAISDEKENRIADLEAQLAAAQTEKREVAAKAWNKAEECTKDNRHCDGDFDYEAQEKHKAAFLSQFDSPAAEKE
jgi:hypothetical protein